MEKNKNTHFEVVREFVDKENNVDDFVILDDSFDDYESALEEAKKQDIIKGEQIGIYETDNNTLDLVKSWVIRIFLNGKAVTLD